jgi:hypothetical protein
MLPVPVETSTGLGTTKYVANDSWLGNTHMARTSSVYRSLVSRVSGTNHGASPPTSRSSNQRKRGLFSGIAHHPCMKYCSCNSGAQVRSDPVARHLKEVTLDVG